MKKDSVQSDVAVNNVEVKDMSANGVMVSAEDVQKQIQNVMRKMDMNEVRMRATPYNKELILGKEIIDKNTGVPRVDSNGRVMTYADKYIVDLVCVGVDYPRYQVTKEQFDELEEGVPYLALGRNGKIQNFGNAEHSPIFKTFERII